VKECSKAISRRLGDPEFATRFFVGSGVDIGGLPDPLALYSELFPRIEHVRTWDWEDGDAQLMSSVEDETFDFVHSSHCLEHLVDPYQGLVNWVRICKPGGFLVITVPDEDLYEQGVFPSTFNLDHKWTFTMNKQDSWSNRSIRLLDLVTSMGDAVSVWRLTLITSGYRFDLPRYDQTLTPVAECAIEVVLRKRSAADLLVRGLDRSGAVATELQTRHLNQYAADWEAAKTSAPRPFTDLRSIQ
jgi:SAM-dependent methyltransferase